MTDAELITTLHHHLSDRETGWSVAVFGAIAEFHILPGMLREVRLTETGGSITSEDGAIRLAFVEGTKFCPYEMLTKRRDYWLQGVNLCLPDADAAMTYNTQLTEIGPDTEAIRVEDRNAILFDLGLGFPAMQAMVRTANPDLITALRGFCGVALLDDGSAFSLLQNASPHRVFRSRLGRVEVFAPIPAPDSDNQTGAHSHIFPDLLQSQRTHSANVTVPDGLTPCFQMYPPNPVLTPEGDARPKMDDARFEAFQLLLERFGQAPLYHAKQTALTAIENANPPIDPTILNRAERTAIRVALRQLAYHKPGNPVLLEWQEVFEREADIPN